MVRSLAFATLCVTRASTATDDVTSFQQTKAIALTPGGNGESAV
ncbi:MAG: hypothetical protein SGI72_18600 [Planctomycetota bacterium]|nr:hypothetical protein [Planctomycetota bacterium]